MCHFLCIINKQREREFVKMWQVYVKVSGMVVVVTSPPGCFRVKSALVFWPTRSLDGDPICLNVSAYIFVILRFGPNLRFSIHVCAPRPSKLTSPRSSPCKQISALRSHKHPTSANMPTGKRPWWLHCYYAFFARFLFLLILWIFAYHWHISFDSCY